ncbi:MAG: cold-shock protein [Limisphaerales bacterium]
MASGKVKWFNIQKGYGFIVQEEGPDILVHHTSILGTGFKVLQEGELVTYEVVEGDKGLRAHNVQRHR